MLQELLDIVKSASTLLFSFLHNIFRCSFQNKEKPLWSAVEELENWLVNTIKITTYSIHSDTKKISEGTKIYFV